MEQDSLDTAALLVILTLVVKSLLDDVQIKGRESCARQELQLRED